MLSILLLTTAISIEASREPASGKKDAYKAISKAFYIETGAKNAVKQIEKQIPNNIKEPGKWIILTTKIIMEKKISLEWSF